MFPQLHHIILDGVIVVLDCMFLWFSYKFALLWQIFLRFPNFLYQLQPRYLPYHDTLVGRVMPKFFSNKFFLNDSHQCSYHNDLKIGLFVGYFLMGWVLIRAGVYCPHLWAQLVTIDRHDVHAKGQGQRSKVKVIKIMTPLSRFRTITPVWIHIWRWNDAQSLMLLRRGAIFFFKVIRKISRSHG